MSKKRVVTEEMREALLKALRYCPSVGAKYGEEKAQLVGMELEGMMREGIDITPEALVERARNPKSALHSLIEWDDKVAAEKWRKHEARQIVNHIEIVVKKSDTEEETKKAFYSITLESKPNQPPIKAYRHVTVLENNEQAREILEAQAQAELRSWAARWEHFQFPSLQGIIGAALRK